MLVTRRGVALVEALVAALLGVAVLAVALRTLVVLQRAVRGEVERSAARATLLDAAHLLRSELGDLDPAAGDLLAIEPARLVYRAVRGTGVVCGVAGDGPITGSAGFRALRLPSPGRDSLLLLPPGGPESWVRAAIGGLPRGATCPGGAAGLAIPSAAGAAAAPGAFLRVFEVIEVRFYTSGGEWWLGFRSVTGGETTQPVAGPFVPGAFGLTYLDAQGIAVANPRAVRSVQFRGSVRVGGAGVRSPETLNLTIPLPGAGTP